MFCTVTGPDEVVDRLDLNAERHQRSEGRAAVDELLRATEGDAVRIQRLGSDAFSCRVLGSPAAMVSSHGELDGKQPANGANGAGRMTSLLELDETVALQLVEML